MAYQINKTDGTVLTTVADSQIDEISSDITLIGKNYSGFGEKLNENLIHMLENFSNSSAPQNPLKGQLWYDTNDLKLKVYSGTAFVPIGSAIVSSTQPTTLLSGDLWYDQTKGQLFFYNGTELKLIGPEYSSAQGKSGLIVDSIFDTNNLSRVVVYLYCGGFLLGIFAKDSFTPRNPIIGFSGDLQPGFNVGTLSGIKFNVTASNSDTLGIDSVNYPLGIPASSYIRNDVDFTEMAGSLAITSADGLAVGENGEISLVTDSGIAYLKVKRVAKENALTFYPSTKRIDFYPEAVVVMPAAGQPPEEIRPTYNFNGDVNISGILTSTVVVEETFTPISSTVEQKNILLAVPTPPVIPSDLLADGGGLILKGTTDHSLIWTQETVAWNSTEHINLAENREYKINGVTVLTGNSLGVAITSAPGISNFGVQDKVEIGEGDPLVAVTELQGTRIRVIPVGSDLQLQAGPSSPSVPAGNISLLGQPRIVGLADPQSLQDAATKNYVDNLVNSRTLVFSIDLSDNKTDSYIINSILNNLAPPSEFIDGTTARILCSVNLNSSGTVDINSNLVKTKEVLNSPDGAKLGITELTVDPITIPAQEITVVRTVKSFRLISGQWSFVSQIALP